MIVYDLLCDNAHRFEGWFASAEAFAHQHTAGQLVFGEKGTGRLQIQGQPIKELKVGDSAYIPGGAFHWHGAAPNEEFTMMFITMGQSKTSQGDPVTDEVYRGTSKK